MAILPTGYLRFCRQVHHHAADPRPGRPHHRHSHRRRRRLWPAAAAAVPGRRDAGVGRRPSRPQRPRPPAGIGAGQRDRSSPGGRGSRPGRARAGRGPAGTFSLGMTQRLGVAAALLGDPGVLLLDEPVNGLDPEGVMWIRTLLRSLAREGRTVFVSSHLMSEMAQTADHVIVIGRGRLIADTSVQEQVRVRSPKADRLAALLRAKGATVEMGADGTMVVRGVDAAAVGELAARHGLALHELVAREASLEEAFMDLTRDAVDYQQQPQKMTRAGRVP